jgi:hypothetical protein
MPFRRGSLLAVGCDGWFGLAALAALRWVRRPRESSPSEAIAGFTASRGCFLHVFSFLQ